MKHIRIFKKFITLFTAAAVLLVFVSCEQITGGSSSSSKSWAYASSSPVYSVGTDVSSLTITGDDLSGKTLYLAKVNPTSTTISSSYTRYVSATTGLSSNISSSLSRSSVSVSSTSLDTDISEKITNFIPPQTFGGKESFASVSSSRSVTASESSSSSSVEVTYSVGNTKSIYVDQDENISSFAAETATCEAVGTYCYVWVVNDYLSDTASGNKVNQTIAEDYAEKFDAMYPMIRNVFGDESNEIYYKYTSSGWLTEDMDLLSDTGTKVNIVIYDIGGGDGSSGSIVGYFYAKDYYPDEDTLKSTSNVTYSTSDARYYSNEGKYFLRGFLFCKRYS